MTRYGGARSKSLREDCQERTSSQGGKGSKENEHVRDDFVKAKGCNDCREKLSHRAGGSLGNDNGGKKVQL